MEINRDGGIEISLPLGINLFVKLIHYHEGDLRLAKESLIELILNCIEHPYFAEELVETYGLESDYVLDLYGCCEHWENSSNFRKALKNGTAYEQD
jgi:hypothetical protein